MSQEVPNEGILRVHEGVAVIHGISCYEQGFGDWGVSHVEHEVCALGQIVDLKSDFYVKRVVVEDDALFMDMVGFPGGSCSSNCQRSSGIFIRMVWEKCSEIGLGQTGKILFDENDGHYGMLGIRLMGRSSEGLLSFIVDGDWFEIHVQCRKFSVVPKVYRES